VRSTKYELRKLTPIPLLPYPHKINKAIKYGLMEQYKKLDKMSSNVL
jgi:hypothetical protein